MTVPVRAPEGEPFKTGLQAGVAPPPHHAAAAPVGGAGPPDLADAAQHTALMAQFAANPGREAQVNAMWGGAVE